MIPVFISKLSCALNRLIQSPVIAAVFISILVVILLTNQIIYGVTVGLRLLGDHLNRLLGLAELLNIATNLESPFHHRISLLNFCFLFGALAFALLTKQFSFQLPSKFNFIWAMVGGILMGLGATIAGGCTIGGLYAPIAIGAPTGFVMFMGTVVGAFFGYKWQMNLMMLQWGRSQIKAITLSENSAKYLGFLLLVILLFWASSWYVSEQRALSHRAIIIIVGVCLGGLMQRSQFCMSSAIRSPIIGGSHQMTFALMVLLVLSTFFCGLVIHLFQIDVIAAVPATFWLGSLLGGLIFGVGMIFGGGCGTGSLWRAAQGSGKSLVTLFFMAWSSSVFTAIGHKYGVLTREVADNWLERSMLGVQYFLNDSLSGFFITNALTVLFILCWYLLIKLAIKSKLFI